MTIEWIKIYCNLFGHYPVGPTYKVTDFGPTGMLEPYVYMCSRCKQAIRFSKQYPNGWVVVGID